MIRQKLQWHLKRKVKVGNDVYYISAVQITPFNLRKVSPFLPIQLSNTSYKFIRKCLRYSFELVVFKNGNDIYYSRALYRTKIQRKFYKQLERIKIEDKNKRERKKKELYYYVDDYDPTGECHLVVMLEDKDIVVSEKYKTKFMLCSERCAFKAHSGSYENNIFKCYRFDLKSSHPLDYLGTVLTGVSNESAANKYSEDMKKKDGNGEDM
jgi:hypothetical protein